MIIQKSLCQRIENLFNRKRNDKSFDDIKFEVKHSKTTNSIYITIATKVEGERFRSTFRFSDHKNSTARTKIVSKTMNFNYIERKVDIMIKNVRKMRYEHLLESIKKK